MTKSKQQQIIKWICKNWQNEDIFDDAVQHFGTSDEVVAFCEKIAKKLEKTLKALPNYLEKELSK